MSDKEYLTAFVTNLYDLEKLNSIGLKLKYLGYEAAHALNLDNKNKVVIDEDTKKLRIEQIMDCDLFIYAADNITGRFIDISNMEREIAIYFKKKVINNNELNEMVANKIAGELREGKNGN